MFFLVSLKTLKGGGGNPNSLLTKGLTVSSFFIFLSSGCDNGTKKPDLESDIYKCNILNLYLKQLYENILSNQSSEPVYIQKAMCKIIPRTKAPIVVMTRGIFVNQVTNIAKNIVPM
jgi:hypothetical protein